MSLTRGRGLPIGARAGLIDPKHVKAMGSARWLYDWILWRVTAEEDGLGYVLGGSPVRCEEIAADLGVGLRTVYRWMGRLRGRYIRTRHAVAYGRHGLVIEVLKSKKFGTGRPSGNPQISMFSTASTGNPARRGRINPAIGGRNNPARVGRFYKEERKPFRESYRKNNSGFLEDLPGNANQRKATPSHLTAFDEKSQSQSQSQNQTQNQSEIFNRKEPVPRACPALGKGEDGPPCAAGKPDSHGVETDFMHELRQMIGAKSFPHEPTRQRRDLLDRQRDELLRRAQLCSLPP